LLSPLRKYTELCKKGVVDGSFIPYSVLEVFKLKEVVHSVLEINLSYTAFAYGMNKKRYESLPASVRQIIDELATKYAAIEAQKHDRWDQDGKNALMELPGRKVRALSKDEWELLGRVMKEVKDAWVKKYVKRSPGLDKFLPHMRAVLQEHGVSDPW